jgi:hypothetical protein
VPQQRRLDLVEGHHHPAAGAPDAGHCCCRVAQRP